MPTIRLHSKCQPGAEENTPSNPLPTLLKTPSGLAILELQGTINLPSNASQEQHSPGSDDTESKVQPEPRFQTPVGRLVFPDYDYSNPPSSGSSWMKRVYLYVGRHQRLTGEVKKLPKPLAIIQRRQNDEGIVGNGEGTAGLGSRDTTTQLDGEHGPEEELEVAEIVRYKILFSSRPEPVSDNVG
ncbi:hypothetical protein PRK78_006325 [Emydomyces testavorans]|uniref:Chromosome transmission fidelity protein 8 n=1 Tax=Emydomyces testavorans TaxID=2070801 RepID=A0AAF0ILJ1_9EURO|nr:hypothetical protein PRK78_006325 [Emydomyces testavorans]